MKFNVANSTFAPENPEKTEAVVRCSKCGLGDLQHKKIETAFWRKSGIVIIRNIPGMGCPICGEEFVADKTALGLDRLRGNGFPQTDAVDTMVVPVFEYRDHKPEGR